MTICWNCRRIQEAAAACVVCGHQLLVPWPSAIERLRESELLGVRAADNPDGWGRGAAFVIVPVSFLAGVLVMFLVATLIGQLEPAVFAVTAFGAGFACHRAQFHLKPTRRKQLKAAPRRRALPPAREMRVGVARAHQRVVSSLLSATPCLASAVIARRLDGQDVCDRVEAVDLWVDADGESILVCGVMTLRGSCDDPDSSEDARAALAVDERALPELDVYELIVEVGARVSVEGKLSREELPELGYRGGSAQVMRGLPGAPVEIRVD